MMDARDRLLEYALERRYRAAPEADLAERIAARHRAGERGPELPHALLTELERTPGPRLLGRRPIASPTTGPRRRALRYLGWITVLGAAAAALVILRPRGAPELAPGTADAPATVARAGADAELWRPGFGVRRGRELALGDVLLVRAEPVELRLGARVVRAAPETVLALAGTTERLVLDLRIGELAVAPGEAPLAMRTRYTALVLPAEGELVLSARPEEAPVEPLEGWLESARDGPALHLVLAVLGGSAQLAYGDVDELLVPGDVRELAARTSDGAVLVIDEARHLAALLEEAFGPWLRIPVMPFELGYGWDGPQLLAAFLTERPRRWARFQAWCDQRWSNPGGGPALRQAIATFLAYVEGPDALRLARELWLETPDAFGLGAQIALAERGAFELERELLAALASPAYLDPVERGMVGAWATLAGHDAGIATLETLVASPALEDLPFLDYLLATLTLERFGHPEAGALARERVRSVVLERLAVGDRRLAGDLLLRAEFVKRRLSAREPARLPWLFSEVAGFVAEHASDVAEESQLRRLLDAF